LSTCELKKLVLNDRGGEKKGLGRGLWGSLKGKKSLYRERKNTEHFVEQSRKKKVGNEWEKKKK